MSDTVTRTAHCACGALCVAVTGTPVTVQACSCLRCQRLSGSAFSYTAFWPTAAASIIGAYNSWRDTAASGRWAEFAFCPTCGSHVFSRVEAWPDVLGLAVGTLADSDFPLPVRLCWARSKPRWIGLPAGMEQMETQ